MKKMKRTLICVCAVLMMISCLSAFACAEEDSGYVTYTVKGGDTVLNICQNLKIDFYANQTWITEVNNIGSYNNIKAGKVLYLPTFNTVKDPTRANKLKDELKKTAETEAKAKQAGVSPVAIATTTSGDAIVSYLISHKLQSGETVGSVCADLGVNFDANADKIKKLSGIANYYHVPAGQTVVIPSLNLPKNSTDTYTAIVAHTVKGGETTGSICNAYGLEFAKVQGQLKALNNTENLNRISVGQTFYLPVPGAAAQNVQNANTATATATQATNTTPANTVAKTWHATKQSSAHGSFVLKVGGNEMNDIPAGSSVNIVASPDVGYKVYTVVVTKAGTEQALPVGNMNFTMPAYDVTVSVTFKAA